MKLTDGMKVVFEEDLELFLSLPPDVQNKTILYKYDVWFHLKPAGTGTLAKLFEESDADKDGKLNLVEWKAFSETIKTRNVERFGGSYTLTEK